MTQISAQKKLCEKKFVPSLTHYIKLNQRQMGTQVLQMFCDPH